MTTSSDKVPPITSALAPDLDAVQTFIADMIAQGSVAALVAAIVGLLVRMRELNTELMKRLASKSRRCGSSVTGWSKTLPLRDTLGPALCSRVPLCTPYSLRRRVAVPSARHRSSRDPPSSARRGSTPQSTRRPGDAWRSESPSNSTPPPSQTPPSDSRGSALRARLAARALPAPDRPNRPVPLLQAAVAELDEVVAARSYRGRFERWLPRKKLVSRWGAPNSA